MKPLLTILKWLFITFFLTGVVWGCLREMGWADEIDIDMTAIRQIESSGNDCVISSQNCIGAYQISTAVLYEYNTYNKTTLTQMDLFYYDTNYRIANWYLNMRIPQMLNWYGIEDTLTNRLIAYHNGIENLFKYIQGKRKLGSKMRQYLRKYKDHTFYKEK